LRTWASWHAQAGALLHVLQERGGWQSAEMVRKYAHLSSEHLAGYVDRMSGGLKVVPQTKGVRFSYSAANEKGLHSCKPLSLWRARRDSNPLPLGS
jgi:hypothetical protein